MVLHLLFLYIYLLIFDGIPCATTTPALPHQSRDAGSKGSHLNTPKPTISVDPRDIWDEVREVTEGSINVDTKDNTPKNLFQPTSFLYPGYGVLFEHIDHPENPNKTHNRLKRDISDTCPVPLLEIQRALDYLSKYGDPITLDADTIFAELQSNATHNRQKRFLGSLIRGITRLFKGGNIFGKIVSGIKKVGGFIFKGIKGLLHRRKNTALLNAARTMATRSKRFIVGKLYKFT